MKASGYGKSRIGRTSRRLALAGAVLCLAWPNAAAVAQTAYPSRAIEIVVGFPAGTTPDLIARVIGEKLKDSTGQPVVIRNMPGASGNLAAAAVAKAQPDGYTILLAGNASLVVNQHLFENLPYDPARDLVPVSQIAITPNILVVPPEVPAKTLQEFVTLARAQQGALTYAHVGVGTSQHLAGVFLESLAGIRMTAVPYKGGPAIYQDLLAGRVGACFCNIGTTLPLLRDGKLRALAVTSLRRSPSAPEIPTLAESGFADTDTSAWFGFAAPAGTPPAIIGRLHQAIQNALTAEIRKSFEDRGMIMADASSPSAFAALIAQESAYWQKIVKANGLKVQ